MFFRLFTGQLSSFQLAMFSSQVLIFSFASVSSTHYGCDDAVTQLQRPSDVTLSHFCQTCFDSPQVWPQVWGPTASGSDRIDK